MRKRLLATLLAVMMVFSLLPATALADTGASSEYTATIDGQGYANLPAAMNNAVSGDVIVLHKDISWPRNPWTVFSGSTGKAVTLDLNGHTMSMGKTIVVSGSGNALTIIDSVGGGSIDVKQRAFNVKGATLTIEGGSFTYTTGLASTSNGGVVNVNGGTFNMNVNNTSFNVTTYGVKANNLFSYYGEWDDAEAAAIQSADDNAVIFAAPSTNSEINAPYVVSFVDNGSDNIAVASFSLAGTMQIRTPDVPEHDNNVTFAGWWNGEEGSEFIPANALIEVSDGVTFTAVWNPIVPEQVTVTADLAGGKIGDFEGTAVGKYDVGTVYAPDTPEREGYEFLGWFVDGGSTQWTSGTLTGDLNLVAKWEQIEYKVQFDPNGGTWDDGTGAAKVEYTTDGSIASIKPADPVRPGYTFTGWWYGDTRWDFNTKVGEDINLTAGWNPIEYTVTVDANGGDLPAGQGDSLKVKYGETVTVQSPTMTGATFMGWVDGNGNTWVSGETPITGDVAIKAVWNTNEYTVIYMDGDTEIHREQVAYGSTITYAQPDAKEGFTFEGWYQDNDFVTPWDMSQGVGGNVTLYAKYTAVTYTVEFNANSGSFINDPTISLNVNANSTIDKTYELGSDDVSRQYYTLIGWATTADATKPDFVFGTGGTPVTEATTLYAVWERDEVTLTFNANGGTFSDGTTTYKEITIDAGTKLTEDLLPEISYEGYSFTGWYWPGGTDRLNITETTFANPATFTAYWDINEYTVTFWANGGAWEGIGDTYPVTVEHGSTVVEANGADITAPEREGMAFTVWLDEDGNIFDPKTDAVTGNLRLTAQWDDVYYKVTFDYGNGQASTVQTVKKGENATPPATPEYDGFEFQYWYIDGVGTEYVFSTPVESNFTLKAMWIPKTYIVTINAGANDAVLNINNAPVTSGPIFTVEVTYGQTIADANVVLNNPTRDGYTFSGWYANGAVWTSDTSITSDIEVTASWNAGRYKIAFDLSGAPGTAPAAQTVGHGGTVSRPTDPSWEGHEFLGWFLKGSDTPWDFSNTVSASATLYAGWRNSSYKVSFEGNGGTFTANRNWTGSYSEDVQSGYRVSAEIANPTRDGYTFAGWFDEDGNAWNASTVITGSVTYYAKWDANSYELTLYANGGAYADGSDVKVYPASETTPIGNVEIPTREGYVFRGWYTRADGGERVEFETTSTLDKDTILYAHWTEAVYQVTYQGQDFSWTNKNVKYGSTVKAPTSSNYDIEGYTITGWYTTRTYDEGTEWNFAEDTVTQNTVLYAKYEAKAFTITFDANGGVGAQYTQSFAFGESKPLTANQFTREGWSFVGWATEKDSGEIVYEDQQYTSFDSADSKDITLYAVWTQTKYTVNYIGADGSIIATKHPVYGGTVTPLKTDPVLDGAEFIGWYYDTDGDGRGDTPWQFATGKIYGDLNLYAMFDVRMLNISYTAYDNGSPREDAVVSVPYNTTVTVNPAGGVYGEGTNSATHVIVEDCNIGDPQRAGFDFLGWVYDADANSFTAQWEAKQYQVYYYKYNANGGPAYAYSSAAFGIGDVITYNTDGGNYNNTIGPNTITVTADNCDKLALTDEVSKEGYEFLGWYYNANGVFKAQWREVDYTVFLKGNGGEVYGRDEYSFTVNYGQTYTLPTPVYEGYTFTGWYDSAGSRYDAEVEMEYAWSGNMEFTAHWDQTVVNVTFMDGGDVIGREEYYYGAYVNEPAAANVPVPEGMEIEGWYTDPEFTAETKWNFDTMTVTDDVTLYVKFEGQNYDITFHGNGGSNADNGNSYTYSVPYGNDSPVPASDYFTRDGYKFIGWSSTPYGKVEIGTDVQKIAVTGDADYYAVWARIMDWGEVAQNVIASGAEVKTEAYTENIANAVNRAHFLVRGEGTVLSVQPMSNLLPDSGYYEDLIEVALSSGGTAYIWAMVKVVPQQLEITTDVSDSALYIVRDEPYTVTAGTAQHTYQTAHYVKVTVEGAPNQEISIELANNNGVLKQHGDITEDYHESTGTSTYTAVYEVVSIPADTQTITFTATDGFGTTAEVTETLNLRTIVYAFIKDGDGSEVSVSNMALHTDYDAYELPPLGFQYNEAQKAYVAIADKASGWDYLRVATEDGRSFDLYYTTGANGAETITSALESTTDGVVTIEYNFELYTIAANIYVNGQLLTEVSASISGNYGELINWNDLETQVRNAIERKYPGSTVGDLAITYAGTDNTVALDYYGQDYNWNWPSNTIYVDVKTDMGYKVTFDLNYDTGTGSNVYTTQDVIYGEAAVKPDDPARDGWIFGGWYTESGCENPYDFSTPVTDNITLYAKWARNTYTVTFNNGYGDDYAAGTPWAPQYVEYQGYLTEPTENPTRDGYKFLGWSTELDGTEYWNFAQNQVLGSFTLYAVWEQNDYTLYYHNVENANNAALFYNVTPIHYGDVINEPEENPERDSFIFQGWYTDAGCTEPAQFPITVGEGDVHLYAKWADAVTVYFVYNDGSGLIDSVKIVKGTAVPEPEIPTYAGHYFTGWYAGVENYGEESENWTNAYEWDFDTQVNDTIFLYAGWESATIQGNFFNKTPTGVYVALERQDYTGNWVPASGIDDLTVGAWRLVNGQPDSDENLLFPGVHMTEILPGSELWQSGWDPDYAYYYATWDTALTGSVRFYLEAEGYTFVSTPGQVG